MKDLSKRYMARKEFSNGIPVTVTVTTSGYVGGAQSDLTVLIRGIGFQVGAIGVDYEHAKIWFYGDIELSRTAEIFQFVADSIRKLLRKDVAQ